MLPYFCQLLYMCVCVCYVYIATYVRESSAKKKVTDHTSEKGKYVKIL